MMDNPYSPENVAEKLVKRCVENPDQKSFVFVFMGRTYRRCLYRSIQQIMMQKLGTIVTAERTIKPESLQINQTMIVFMPLINDLSRIIQGRNVRGCSVIMLGEQNEDIRGTIMSCGAKDVIAWPLR